MRVRFTSPSGKTFRVAHLLSFALSESLFLPAGALDITVAEPIAEPLSRVTVYDGDVLIFDGFVDRQMSGMGTSGPYTRLRARSRGALLLDNEAKPQTYLRTTLTDIFRRHIEPYGFVRVTGHCPTLSTFVVGKGQSQWEVLLSFLEQTSGAYPYLLPSGEVVAESYLKSEHRVQLSNTKPGAGRILSYEVCYNRYAPISKVLLANADGFYTSGVTNPYAVQAGITHLRYYTPPKDATPDKRGANAKLLLRNSMRDYFSVEVLTAGVTASLRDECVLSPLADLGALFVTEREVSLKQGGWQTRLKLQNKAHLELPLR